MKGQPPSPEAAAPRRNLAVPPPSWRARTGGTARPSAHLAAWSPPPRSPQGRHRRRTTLLSKKWVFSQASYRTSRHVQIWSFATGVKRRKPQGVALPLLSFSVGQTGTFLCSASLSVTLRETEICKRTESQYPPQPAHGRAAGGALRNQRRTRGQSRPRGRRRIPCPRSHRAPHLPGPDRVWWAAWWPQGHQVLMPRTCKCDLIWKKGLCRWACVKDSQMRRQCWVTQGALNAITSVL